ncbi:MAG: hypothetical protein K8L97_17245 [Anaerolineae bacterium]|nr:hypothetical protein [Anaerolineae bacterium]
MTERLLVHVEDDPIWGEILEESIASLETKAIDRIIRVNSIRTARETLSVNAEYNILVVDLQLGERILNFDGLDWLLEESKDFLRLNENVDVFVISGQLHKTNIHLLIRSGIPIDHIYDKGEWAEVGQQKFVAELRKILQRLSLKPHFPSDRPICEISVVIEGTNESESPLIIQQGKSYVLKVNLRSLLNPHEENSLIGHRLDIYILCPKLIIRPKEYTVLSIPEPEKSVSAEFTLRLESHKSSIPSIEDLTILVYHERHLTNTLKFQLKLQ